MKISASIFTIIFFAVAFVIVLSSCSASIPDFKILTTTNPEWLIAKEDSLLQAFPNNEDLTQALVDVHLAQGETAFRVDNWDRALVQFQRVTTLAPHNKEGRYGQALANGRKLFKKGGPNDLWEAIVKFGEAAVIDTAQGEPNYWLARSYEKKDENDFELIVEAYDKALSKHLPPDLKKEAEEARAVVMHRKEIYEAFWK